MGSGGNLVFDPAEVTIKAGESIHFVNGMLPPHNVVVEDHPELGHDGLAMLPDETFDVTFNPILVTTPIGVLHIREQEWWVQYM